MPKPTVSLAPIFRSLSSFAPIRAAIGRNALPLAGCGGEALGWMAVMARPRSNRIDLGQGCRDGGLSLWRALRPAVPFGDVPGLRVPGCRVVAFESIGDTGGIGPVHKRDDGSIRNQEIVHPHEQRASFLRVNLRCRFLIKRVVLAVAVSAEVHA